MSEELGVRYNSKKVPITMLLEAASALEGCSAVMAFGAKKYARANWRKGLPLTEVADSLSRHLVRWLSGENLDPETGLSHLDHLLCNAIFLSELAKTKPELDDRPFIDGVFVGKSASPENKLYTGAPERVKMKRVNHSLASGSPKRSRGKSDAS